MAHCTRRCYRGSTARRYSRRRHRGGRDARPLSYRRPLLSSRSRLAALASSPRPAWLLGWSRALACTPSSSSQGRLRTMLSRPMSAGFGSRSSERPAVRAGRRAHPVPAHRRLPSSGSHPARLCECVSAAGAVKPSGRLQEPAAGTAAAPAARRSTRGKAGSGGGGATDVRRGGDGLAHRIIVGAGGSGGAGGAIGGPIGTGGGNGGDLTEHEGFAVLGSANPATGGEAAPRRAAATPAETRPISRSRRRPAPSGSAATAPQASQRRRRWRRRALRRRRRRFQPLLQRRPRRRRLGLRPCGDGFRPVRRRLRARADQLRPESRC